MRCCAAEQSEEREEPRFAEKTQRESKKTDGSVSMNSVSVNRKEGRTTLGRNDPRELGLVEAAAEGKGR